MESRWRLVSGTSAVGIRKASSPLHVWLSGVILNKSSSNLGSWEVPSREERETTSGTAASVYPWASTWVSRKKEERARSKRAIFPLRAENRAPDMATASSAIQPFNPTAKSSCHDGSKSSPHSNFVGRAFTSPHSITKAFSLSSLPSGTTSSNKLGRAANNPFCSPSITDNFPSNSSANSPAAVLAALAPSNSLICSSLPSVPPLVAFIILPTVVDCTFRSCSALFLSLIRTTRSAFRVAMRSAEMMVSGDARRDRRCDRTKGRFSVRVLASREFELDDMVVREIRPLTNEDSPGGGFGVSSSEAENNRVGVEVETPNDTRGDARW
mmetsp:Transcript_12694/g.14552  ORF Transcript_12694/g.14552 Transcript_12694/m.14552 type:complete len:326 (+) Transcript_12694:678-1655(+)